MPCCTYLIQLEWLTTEEIRSKINVIEKKRNRQKDKHRER